MANQISASIYGINDQSVGTAQGVTMGFPSQGVLIRPAPVGKVFNGVTMVTMIQILPHGTRVAQDQYFTPTATQTVITAGA